MFRTALILSLGCLFFVGGCVAPQSTAAEEEVAAEELETTRSFYERTIIYRVEPGARQYMVRLERLLEQVIEDRHRTREGRVPERYTLALYRDTDANRDYYISTQEAANYFREVNLRFEDRAPEPWIDITQ